MIYFIQNRTNKAIKIGFTSGDVRHRLRALQTASPDRLEVIAEMAGGMEDERDLHRRFSEHRVAGEWFKPCDELLAEISWLNGSGHHPLEYDCFLICISGWVDNKLRYLRMEESVRSILGREPTHKLAFQSILEHAIRTASALKPNPPSRLIVITDRMPSDPREAIEAVEGFHGVIDTLFYGDERDESAKFFMECLARNNRDRKGE